MRPGITTHIGQILILSLSSAFVEFVAEFLTFDAAKLSIEIAEFKPSHNRLQKPYFVKDFCDSLNVVFWSFGLR
jgi:hypothetical protein